LVQEGNTPQKKPICVMAEQMGQKKRVKSDLQGKECPPKSEKIASVKRNRAKESWAATNWGEELGRKDIKEA